MIFEFDRTVLAVADGREVGLGSVFSLRMSVPGGQLLPTAGVTWVGVLATHRRRGVLTAMMRKLLDDAREHGDPVAALWATDPAIYGRFGYGIATRALSATIPTARGSLGWAPPDRRASRSGCRRPWTSGPTSSRWRNAWRDTGPVASCGRRSSGTRTSRTGPTTGAASPPHGRSSSTTSMGRGRSRSSARRSASASRCRPATSTSVRSGTSTRRQPPCLWRTLLGHDLIDRVNVRNLPVDDPLFWLLSNPRSPQATLKDAMHVRLLDVPRALEARTYAVPVDVVLDLADPFAPWCAGRYRLTAGPDGASCVPTSDAAGPGAGRVGARHGLSGRDDLTALADAGRVASAPPARSRRHPGRSSGSASPGARSSSE